MRRLMLLAILALALPTSALADSLSFNETPPGRECLAIGGVCRTGDFVSGSISSQLVAPFNIEVIGSTNTIMFQIRDLSCSTATTCTIGNAFGTVGGQFGFIQTGGPPTGGGEITKTDTTAVISALYLFPGSAP